MNALRKLLLTVGTAGAALALLAGPAAADEEPADDAPAEEMPADEEPADEAPAEEAPVDDADTTEAGERIQIAETPRDRIGLILFAALIAGGGLAFANARRQMKGERPQATGEFRWR